MFFRILYDFILLVATLLYLPVFLYQFIVKGKYRSNVFQRLGSNFPRISKGKRPLIWIHAVSLGETKAVATLAKTIKEKFENPILVFSSTTETGHVEACRSIPADYHVYLPFDFGWIIRPIVQRTSPDLVILTESDFWYNFLSAAKECGAFTTVVNAKISPKSFKRFSNIPFFSKRLFGLIDLFCAQSKHYYQRFLSLGINPSRVVLTGNIKFDGDFPRLPPQQLETWKNELFIQPTDRILVVGSSHAPEESLLLGLLPKVWEKVPNLKVLIVPRHPERFNEVVGILQKSKVNFRRLSQKQDDPQEHIQVILVDAMGLLRKCYQLADVAIVAGSYTTKVGGHNILEPCWFGVPTLFGPYMFGQPELLELVLEYQAGEQVPIEQLADKLLELLLDEKKRKALGEAGLKLASEVQGATAKTIDAITTRMSHYPIMANTEK